MPVAAAAAALATHGSQVAVETSEDRRNRNETGWSPTPPAHNASSPLFLAERAGIPKLPLRNCPTGLRGRAEAQSPSPGSVTVLAIESMLDEANSVR